MKAKNLFSMAALALVGACISACSGSDEIVTEQPVQPTGGPIVIKGELAPKGGETRSTVNDAGVATWSSGDQIAIVQTSNPTQKVIATVSVGNTSEFSATLPDNSWLSKEVKLIYPASCENMDLVNNTVFSTEGIESQGGTQASLSNWDICVGTMTLPGVLPTSVNGVYNVGSVTLTPQMSVCKFVLQKEESEAIYTTGLTLNVVSGENTDTYTLSPGSATNTLYVAMKPATGANISIFTAPASGKVYGTTLSSVTMESGTIYNTTLTMNTAGVQLWENGPIWATMNVGATKEHEFGLYFQWGDISGCEEDPDSYTSAHDYWWNAYRFSQYDSPIALDDYDISPNFKKYCYTSSYGYNGFTDQLTELELKDDAARRYWGGNWRMPTKEDFEQLVEKCDYEAFNGVDFGQEGGYNNTDIYGIRFRGRGDYSANVIFIPWAGYCYMAITSQNDYYDKQVNWLGRYWTSNLVPIDDTIDGDGSKCAYTFDTGFDYYYPGMIGSTVKRYEGCTIRPIMSISE